MKECIEHIKPYVPEAPITKNSHGIRLSANESVYGTAPFVEEGLIEYIQEEMHANRYPDGNCSTLKEAIAAFHDVSIEQVTVAVGLDEMISIISRAVLTTGGEVLISQPSFAEYALQAQIEGSHLVTVPAKDNGYYDWEALVDRVTPRTQLVWLGNPNNPTGTYEKVEFIEAFIKRLPSSVVVAIDEAYIDFVTSTKEASALRLLETYDNVLILRTFSKAYGLANFRVGYMIASPSMTDYMNRIRLPYNVSGIAQRAAELALSSQVFIQGCVEANHEERNRWGKALRRYEAEYYASEANFIFFTVPYAAELVKAWHDIGYTVREGLRPNWIRLTIPREKDGDLMLGVFKQLHKQYRHEQEEI